MREMFGRRHRADTTSPAETARNVEAVVAELRQLTQVLSRETDKLDRVNKTALKVVEREG